jgi:hypothetical protein
MSRPLARALLGTALTLIGAEATLRLISFTTQARHSDAILRAEDPLRDVVVDDEHALFALPSNATLQLFPFDVTTVDHGFRATTPSAQEGALRVAALGGSNVFGAATAWPLQLQDVASSRNGRAIAAIAAGVPNSSSLQGLARLERDVLPQRPDIVFWMFGPGDAETPRDGLDDDERRDPRGLAKLARVSALVDFAHFVVARLRGDDLPPADPRLRVSRIAPARAGELLAIAAERCAAQGVRFVAVTEPHALIVDETAEDAAPLAPSELPDLAELLDRRRRLDAAAHATRAAARRAGVPLLDLHSIFATREPETLFEDPYPGNESERLSPLGHRLAAEEAYALLLDVGEIGEVDVATAAGAPLPRLTAGASELAIVAADLDGDGGDELVVAATVGDAVDVAVVDLRTGSVVRRHAAVLPAPHTRLDAARLDLPGAPRGAILFAAVAESGTSRLAVTDSAGEALPLDVSRLAGGRRVQAIAADLDGDGRREIALDLGLSGAPRLQFVDGAFQPSATLVVDGAPHDAWLTLAAGRAVDPARDTLFAAFLERGDARLVVLRPEGDARRFHEAADVRFGQRRVPIGLCLGRFATNAVADGLVIARGAFVTALDRVAPCFPFGATRFDPRLPPPRLIVVRDGGRDRAQGPDEVLVAIADASGILTVNLAGTSVTPGFRLSFGP